MVTAVSRAGLAICFHSLHDYQVGWAGPYSRPRNLCSPTRVRRWSSGIASSTCGRAGARPDAERREQPTPFDDVRVLVGVRKSEELASVAGHLLTDDYPDA